MAADIDQARNNVKEYVLKLIPLISALPRACTGHSSSKRGTRLAGRMFRSREAILLYQLEMHRIPGIFIGIVRSTDITLFRI